MHDIHRVVRIKDEDYLNVASRGCLPTDAPFVISDLFGIGRACVVDEIFRLGRRHSVPADMVFVPFVPSVTVAHAAHLTSADGKLKSSLLVSPPLPSLSP